MEKVFRKILRTQRISVRLGATFSMTALLLAVALQTASAKEGWKKRPASEWTREEAVEFLTKSPWAKEVDVWQLTGRQVQETMRQQTQTYSDAPGEPPVSVSTATASVAPEQVEGRYRVVWSSAELVRRGWERLRQLDPTLAEQHDPGGPSTRHHVVTVRVAKPPQGAPVLFAGLSAEELRVRAALQVGKERLTAEQALVHGTGAAQAVSFSFPRDKEGRATLAEAATVEFVFESPAGDRLKHKFTLKDMTSGGKPDY
jgi:hypothetical protein